MDAGVAEDGGGERGGGEEEEGVEDLHFEFFLWFQFVNRGEGWVGGFVFHPSPSPSISVSQGLIMASVRVWFGSWISSVVGLYAVFKLTHSALIWRTLNGARLDR